MRSNTDVDSSTSAKLTTWLKEQAPSEHDGQAYPIRGNRFYTSTRQDCYTKDDIALMQRVQSAYEKLADDNAKKYFDTTEESHWYGWWQCIKPAYHTMLRKHDAEPFTLPNREAKDSKVFPLWDYSDRAAKRIANWQAERAENQNSDLVNDPVMLVFEELRDWFFNVLAVKECKKEDLAYLTRRQSYIKNLIHIIPDFGKDRLHLQELQQSLEEGYRIALAHVANKELPQLLSDIIIDAKSLENTLGTYLHFLLPNEKVADNFSPACLETGNQACGHSPVGKVYQAARASAASDEAISTTSSSSVERYQSLNSLYALTSGTENDGIIQIQPQLRTEAANAIEFASFVTPQDKKTYVEALAILEALSKVRNALESFRKVQSSIGTYFFAYNYLDKTDKLAANYITLVTRANLVISQLIQVADTGLNKILTNPTRYKAINKYFESNLRTLETSVVHGTTLKDQLDEYCRKAVTSMNQYNNKMAELVSDIHSGKATDEVERAMQELFTQVNDLNAMLTAVLNNKELLIDTKNAECIDTPFSAHCNKDAGLITDGTDVNPKASDSVALSGFDIPHENKITAAWDNVTRPHPATNAPIYTYRIFHDGIEIGSAEYYGQPSLCASADGTRHNIMKRTGFLTELPEPDPAHIKEICQAHFPTTYDRAFASAKFAGGYGVVRGMSNLAGDATLKAGYSPQTASYVSQLLYYGTYFTTRYYAYSQQAQDIGDTNNSLNAMYQAATDTGQKLLFATAINYASNALEQAGSTLEKNNWHKTGYAIKQLGTLTRYGIFAATTAENGIAESSAALAAGTAAEVATERVGKFLIGN